MGDGTAFNIIDKINNIPFIILTGAGDENIAIQAMKKGAYDYIIKDVTGSYLKNMPSIIENTIKRKALEEEIKNYQKNLEQMVEKRTEDLKKEIEEHEKDAENAISLRIISEKKIKEFNIICRLMKKLTDDKVLPGNLFDDLIISIINYLQYPEMTFVRMVLEGKEYSSTPIKNAGNKIKVDIADDNNYFGFLEASRSDDYKEIDNELFSEQEIDFLKSISEKIIILIKILKKLIQKDNSIIELKSKLDNINNKIEELKEEVISIFNKKIDLDINKITDEFVYIKKILIN